MGSHALIVFVAICLIVSTDMVEAIAYVSILEPKLHIVILRS